MTSKNPYYGATFAERKAIRLGVDAPAEEPAEDDTKAVQADAVENKAVAKKTTSRKKG